MTQLKTEIVTVDAQEPDSEVILYAAKVVRQGGIVALPTDTVYGLVCDPLNANAIDRIYRVKGRRRDLPLILLLQDMAQVSRYVEDVPEAAARAAQEFWPGPLTLILRDRSEATAAVRAKKDTVGLRLPAHMVPRMVAGEAGAALASTSANRSRQPAATSSAQVIDQLEGLIDLVVDGGPAPLGQESTVVSFVGRPPQVIRAGAVTTQRLREVLGEISEK